MQYALWAAGLKSTIGSTLPADLFTSGSTNRVQLPSQGGVIQWSMQLMSPLTEDYQPAGATHLGCAQSLPDNSQFATLQDSPKGQSNT